jgi:hypothetical protein
VADLNSVISRLTAEQPAKTARVRTPRSALMRSTYVDFQGQGFKARDATLEVRQGIVRVPPRSAVLPGLDQF